MSLYPIATEHILYLSISSGSQPRSRSSQSTAHFRWHLNQTHINSSLTPRPEVGVSDEADVQNVRDRGGGPGLEPLRYIPLRRFYYERHKSLSMHSSFPANMRHSNALIFLKNSSEFKIRHKPLTEAQSFTNTNLVHLQLP